MLAFVSGSMNVGDKGFGYGVFEKSVDGLCVRIGVNLGIRG